MWWAQNELHTFPWLLWQGICVGYSHSIMSSIIAAVVSAVVSTSASPGGTVPTEAVPDPQLLQAWHGQAPPKEEQRCPAP